MKNVRLSKASATVILWIILGVIYSPIYICAWVLRIVARFLLSISYFGMFNGKMGRDVFKSLFSWSDYKV